LLEITSFEQSLHRLNAQIYSNKYVLAVSGGADSMVLLYFFVQLKLDVEVTHINYGLRGEDSAADEQLVRDFCKKYRLKLHVYTASDTDGQPENSIQEWARNLRYDYFNKIKHQCGADFIVTAHHLNDQLETFLINLSKAAGLQGLSGIPEDENGILRPLLIFSKEEIYNAAKNHDVAYREDRSNAKDDYTRNFIRNQITPKLQKINTHFLENFAQSLSHLKEQKEFLKSYVSSVEKLICQTEEHYIIINKQKFFGQEGLIQFEILRKYGFQSRTEIAKIKSAQTGKVFYGKNIKLTVDRQNLVLVKASAAVNEQKSYELQPDENGSIDLSKILGEESFSNKKNWEFDANVVKLPLCLRRPAAGDIFQPIGMIGKKKIAKFFKDEKIPILARSKSWILCDAAGQILGLVPYRQDSRSAANKNSAQKITVLI